MSDHELVDCWQKECWTNLNKQVNKVRYFEDFEVGQSGATSGRTITTAEIVSFAGITGDYHSHHMDRNYMKSSVYGTRVAHGLLGFSIGTGLLSQHVPHILGNGVPGAQFHSFSIDYREAIKLDDTIRVHWRVAEVSEVPGKGGFGKVKTSFELVNQEGSSPYRGSVMTLVKRKGCNDAVMKPEQEQPWRIDEFVEDPGKIYYVEDFPLGRGGESVGRTITEADIVNFAALTGDYDPRYVDAIFARSEPAGQRIAHGVLVFSIGFPLAMYQYRHLNRPESGFAGHLNDSATFLRPVMIGDTIRANTESLRRGVRRLGQTLGL